MSDVTVNVTTDPVQVSVGSTDLAHRADADAAHAGSAVSFTDAGLAVITGVTDVQAALAAVDAELASLSGTFEPARTSIWIPAGELEAVRGSPTQSNIDQRANVWSMPAGSFTALSFSKLVGHDIPTAWTTLDVKVRISNSDATTGATVTFRSDRRFWADGESPAGFTVGGTVDWTTLGQYLRDDVTLLSGITVEDADDLFTSTVVRRGDTDSHAAAVYVHGVLLEKAS